MWSFSSRVVLRHYTGVLCLVARLSCSKTSRESWWRVWTCPRNVCLSVEPCHREPKFQMIAYHQIRVTSTPTTPNFWAPGHVGSSSCPAGPLEEALRGVDFVPSRIVHGLIMVPDKVEVLILKNHPDPHWFSPAIGILRLQKLLPHRDIVTLRHNAATPSLWKKNCCRVMLHYDTDATSQHVSPIFMALLMG